MSERTRRVEGIIERLLAERVDKPGDARTDLRRLGRHHLRQYRWAVASWMYEVPAGKLQPGEAPEACAARELIEETGYRAGRLEQVGSIWTTPGYSDEVIHLFVARELTPARQALEVDEVLEVQRVAFDEILGLIRRGELRDTKSLCALLHVVLASPPAPLHLRGEG